MQESIEDLQSENRCLKAQVNMSNVKSVQLAEEKEHKASMDAYRAREDAKTAIEKAEKTADTRIRKMELYADRLKKRDCIFAGLVAVVLLIGAVVHTGFWTDLFSFLDKPFDEALPIWIDCFSTAPDGSEVARWFALILIPVVLIAGVLGLAYLLVRIRLKWNILTISFCVIDLAICIFLGDALPFNRIYLMIGLAIGYILFCSWADQTWTGYEQKDRWEKFQRELIWE